jgi:hypothetical protein
VRSRGGAGHLPGAGGRHGGDLALGSGRGKSHERGVGASGTRGWGNRIEQIFNCSVCWPNKSR